MKTLKPLTLASLALALVSLNVVAGEALLSPRARDNQIRVVATTDSSPNTVTQNRDAVASPRTIDNQIKTVAGTDTSPDTLTCNRKMLASPKALGECTSHPGLCASACCMVAGK